MSISWPSLAQGTNIGYLHTSLNGDKWRWNGYSWDLSSLQSSGNYGGSWIIFDSSYSPNYFSTLELALASAVSGDTIYLASSKTESRTSQITLKNNVTINLNGNPYTFVCQPPYFNDAAFIAASINCTITNGTIDITNIQNANSFIGFYASGFTGNTDLSELKISANCNATGRFEGSLTGGHFYNDYLNGTAVVLYAGGQPTFPMIFKKIKGESIQGIGIHISQ